MSAEASLLLNCWHQHSLQWTHSSREEGGRPAGSAYSYNPPLQYASLARISFAHCRLHHRQHVQPADVFVAIALTEQSHAARAFSVAAAEKLAATSSLFCQPTTGESVGLHEFVATGMAPSNDGRLGVEGLKGCVSERGVLRQVEGWVELVRVATAAYNRHHADLIQIKDERNRLAEQLRQEEEVHEEQKDKE